MSNKRFEIVAIFLIYGLYIHYDRNILVYFGVYIHDDRKNEDISKFMTLSEL